MGCHKKQAREIDAMGKEQAEQSLLRAAVFGDLQWVRHILSTHNAINVNDIKGPVTPLLCATFSSNLEVVKYLVEVAKADVDARNGTRFPTPIYLACAQGDMDLVRFLFCNGANLRIEVDGMHEISSTPLRVASHCGRLDVIDFLVNEIGLENLRETDDVKLAILGAVASEEFDILQYFVERHQIDVNFSVKSSSLGSTTPLYQAAVLGHYAMVEFLVENGAQVDMKDGDGETPLFVAAFSGHVSVVSYLLERGANVHLTANSGMTPLYAAIIDSRHSVACELLRFGADPNFPCPIEQGQGTGVKVPISPFLLAVVLGELDLIRVMVNHYCAVLDHGNGFWPPVHAACRYGHVDCLEDLVGQGTDFNQVVYSTSENEPWTPLQLASTHDHLDCIFFLVRRCLVGSTHSGCELQALLGAHESLQLKTTRLEQ
mmetsp:Transcript_2739/g.7662  ORF Transcript_2739/g.7662 Transcript_2739/m.7662 type:complete len:431 (-) Transcript_2739:43-1335(-)